MEPVANCDHLMFNQVEIWNRPNFPHIDKWAQNGAKDRVLRLVEAYKKAVAERQKGKE